MVMLKPGNPPAPELSGKEKMGMAFSDIEGIACVDKAADAAVKAVDDNDSREDTIQRIEKQQLEQKVASSCCLLARIMDTDARNQEQAARQWRRFKKRHRHQERGQENSLQR